MRVLGPVTMVVDRTVMPASGPRSVALLALLLLHRNDVVGTDRIADVLWRDQPPGNVANAIQARVSQLRRAFAEMGTAPIETIGDGYRLVVPPGSVDADRFEQLVMDGRRQLEAGEADAAASSFGAALGLWDGAPYPELPDDPTARAEATRLEGLRRSAVLDRSRAQLALGRHVEAVPELQARIEIEPLDEDLHGLLVTALYRAGRQTDALDVVTSLRDRLRDELGIDPGPAIQQLHRAVLEQDERLGAVAPSADAPRPGLAPLPVPLTSFVGRDAEVAEVTELLDVHRMVSLTGPGGSGKTRLAIEVARRTAPPRETVMVELATLGQAVSVLATVAATLGLSSAPVPGRDPRTLAERVAEAVRGRDLLVVLDNCEHLVDAAADAAALLLASGPGTRVLATSREGLRVPGETICPVPPLGLPADGLDDLEALAHSPAVALFLDRARAVAPGFALDTGTARPVVELCRRLDGLPLAIELAAARVAAIPVSTLAQRLGDRFSLLTGGARTATRRQQTLEAVVEWSHALLDAPQRALFRRLGVLATPATLATIEAVCADDDLPVDIVLPVLGQLVDKSLVTLDHTTTPPRYRMLETLREFALRRLVAEGDAGAARTRHLAWFLEVARQAWVGLRTAEQLYWLDRLSHEHEDLRAATTWAIETDPGDALRLTTSLAWFWWLRDHHTEGVELLTASLDAAEGLSVDGDRAVAAAWVAFLHVFRREEPPVVEAALAQVRREEDQAELDDLQAAIVRVLSGFAGLAIGGDPDTAIAEMDTGEAHARRAGDQWAVAAAAYCRAEALLAAGRPDEARAEARRATAVAEAAGDRWAVFQSRQWLGGAATNAGAYDEALEHLAAAAELADQLGLGGLAASVRVQRALTTMLAGELDVALGELEAALAEAIEQHRGLVAAFAHHGLGMVHRRAGHVDDSVRHHQAAVAGFGASGDTVGRGEALAELAIALAARGDAGEARETALDAFDAIRGTGRLPSLALAAEAAAAAAAAVGDGDLAGRLLGWATAARRRQGMPLAAGERHDVDRIDADARRLAGDTAVDDGLAGGASADLDQLVGQLHTR